MNVDVGAFTRVLREAIKQVQYSVRSFIRGLRGAVNRISDLGEAVWLY